MRWKSFWPWPLLCFVFTPAMTTESTPEELEPGMVNPGYETQPDWFKVSFLDMQEDIVEAAEADKHMMLYFYQDGCPYCTKLLRENFAIKDIVDKTRANFDVIAINLWGDREVIDFAGKDTTEKEFAATQKVMFTPTILLFDRQGEVALRINGYYPPHKFSAALDYVIEDQAGRQGFGDYYQAIAPAPASGELHQDPSYLQPPYRLPAAARNTKRPLLVLFEQASCPPCDELHRDILSLPETRKLAKSFDVVLLNLWSRDSLITPTGEEMPIVDWARELDIKYAPSMVFFDVEGNEVFRVEAYFRTFHIQSALDYVARRAYLEQPSFQRFVEWRAAAIEQGGEQVESLD